MFPRGFVVTFGLWLVVCAAQAQPDLVLFRSPPGEPVGRGATYLTTNTADYSIVYWGNAIEVFAFGFQAWFVAPSGENLMVRQYLNAVRFPPIGDLPGLAVSGPAVGCNTLCGEFYVRELQTSPFGQITRLWVTFSQTCSCDGPALSGDIRYHSQLAPPPPAPRTLHVPSEYPTIQAALNDAGALATDTILVAPGTYHEAIQFGGARARVISTDGPSVTIIDPPGDAFAVTFNGNESLESTIRGFTLTNGAQGVYVRHSTPTILSNIIVNCGIGIEVFFGVPTIRGNRISGNGRGLFLQGDIRPLLEGNIIETNETVGISMFNARWPIIRNNIIRGNGGDGINMLNPYEVDIIQNLIVGNTGSGIAWYVPYGTRGPLVLNNTIADNLGAGIAADGYHVDSLIINNIIVGKVGLSMDDTPPIIQFNNIYSTIGRAYDGSVGNLTGVAGNISVDPLFACPAADDFRPVAVSPCVDAGTNGAALLPETDLEGQVRILDGKTNGQAIVDMGAFEINPAAAPVPCLYIVCPPDVVVTAAAGQDSLAVNYPNPGAHSAATLSNSPPSGSVFPVGTNLVTCTASYETNTVSCTFQVVVVAPPTITSQPRGTNVYAGQPVNLSVQAAGTPPFTYRWTFNGITMKRGTNATLTIANPQAPNAGIYRVIVSNIAGSVTSKVTRVTVLPSAPIIVANPQSLSVPASSNVTFTVWAIGSQPLTYQWLFNGATIVGATGPQYTISNVQAANAGRYRVIVRNAYGVVTSAPATLTVTPSAPYFVTQPQSVSVPVGGGFTLTSLARGSKPITYQWRRGDVILNAATKPSLVRSNVVLGHTGPYTVIASNIAGMTTSIVAQVTVSESPRDPR